MPVRIIDTHVHVWNFDRAEYAWLKGDTTILNRSYHLEELEEERIRAGVTDGILVQAANNADDTEWMLEVAGRTPWICGVVGWLPLMDPDATETILSEKWNPYLCGFRHLIHNEPDPRWLLQERVVKSLRIVAQHNFSFDLVGINNDHLQTALELAGKIPELKMVVDHLNQPPMKKNEGFGKWGELMKQAARHPLLHAKISGLGTASGNFTGWTAQDIRPAIEFVLEQFGQDRCFCGGDWPVSLLAGTYSATWNSYRSILDGLLAKEQRAKVYSENAKRFYRLD